MTTGTSTDTGTGVTIAVQLEVAKLVITTSAQTLTAGTASAEYTVQTQNELGAREPLSNTDIKMSSDSTTGTFSATAGGAYTTTLTQTIAVPGANSTTFFYKDTVSGTPTITAAEDPAESPDWTNATQQQTVNPGTLTSTNVQPESLNNNAVGDVDVSFTTVNPIPADGKIVVTLPSGFTISSGGTTDIGADGTSFDGSETVTLAGIPQIKPTFLEIAPSGIPSNIIPHSKGVQCGLIRSNSPFSYSNHRPAKPKIPKPLVYAQVSPLGTSFATP